MKLSMNAMFLGINGINLKKKKKKKKRSKVSRWFKSKIPKELKLKLMRLKKRKGLKNYLFPSNPKRHFEGQLLLESFSPYLKWNEVDEFDSKVDEFDSKVESVRCELNNIFYECEELNRIKSRSSKSNKLKVGKPAHLKSLLGKGCLLYRNGGNYSGQVDADQVELLNQRKYLMLCCFSVPDTFDSYAWNAAVTSFQLYSEMSNYFEMVIVLVMKPGWTKDESAFQHFLSAFHPSCLVVPFQDESRRRQIWLDLGPRLGSSVLVLAPGGNVVLHTGAECLEFIPWHIPKPHLLLHAGDAMEKNTPKYLSDFLCCDYVFRHFPHSQQAFISELESKVVALYLYKSGELMPLVCEMDQKCRKSNKELEIVVLHCPECHTRDPFEFPDLLSGVLAKRSASFWVAPFSNTAYLLLNQMYFDMEEKVVIVGPNGRYVDCRGAEVFQIYGVDAHPFTFKHVVERTVEELRQVELTSFLNSLCPLPLGELSSVRKREILIYFDCWLYDVDLDVHEAFKSFKLEGSVILRCTNVDAKKITKSKMKTTNLKWYKCVGELSKNFFQHFFLREFSSILEFGEDGKISSVLAQRFIKPAEYPPLNGLEEEVSYLLDEYYVDQELKDLISGYGHVAESWVAPD